MHVIMRFYGKIIVFDRFNVMVIMEPIKALKYTHNTSSHTTAPVTIGALYADIGDC